MTETVSRTPLWSPSPELMARSNMAAFMEAATAKWGHEFPDYSTLHRWSLEEPEQFWLSIWEFGGVIAGTQGTTVLEHKDKMPGARWFPQARLNFAENLLRRRDDSTVIVFWGEHGAKRKLSTAELYDQVSITAQALHTAGIRSGDRVAGYLPNIPEAIVAMLAATSLGAIWSSCSPDFGVAGVLDRFGQIEPKILFTADGYFYNGKTIGVLDRVADIAKQLPSVQQVVVIPYAQSQSKLNTIKHAQTLSDFTKPFRPTTISFGRLPFDHPLYILYSSGTTGAPKCIVHSVGGTLLQHLKEHLLHVDEHPGDRLFYFTTCGWMMWNWLVSGLATGATLMLFDGAPFYPKNTILFDYIDGEGINIFGTSAKFIDAANKAGLAPIDTHQLTTLKTILSTGSPLVPEGFDYVYTKIKKDVCLSSISGGTDIISCFVGGNPLLPVWRGEIQCRALGMNVDVWDDDGHSLHGEKGELVCTQPFPSLPIGFWNDPEGKKYHSAYFAKYPNVWHHGDYVELTEHGGMIIYGRSDTVLNPGGVRIGTAEIYRQVEQLPEVMESLVIGQNWEQDVRVVLFVRLQEGLTLDSSLIEKIKLRIRNQTTPRHVPARIVQVTDIPRTKSGKIVELAVRHVVHDRPVKNIEALANPEALELFRDRAELRT